MPRLRSIYLGINRPLTPVSALFYQIWFNSRYLPILTHLGFSPPALPLFSPSSTLPLEGYPPPSLSPLHHVPSRILTAIPYPHRQCSIASTTLALPSWNASRFFEWSGTQKSATGLSWWFRSSGVSAPPICRAPRRRQQPEAQRCAGATLGMPLLSGRRRSMAGPMAHSFGSTITLVSWLIRQGNPSVPGWMVCSPPLPSPLSPYHSLSYLGGFHSLC